MKKTCIVAVVLSSVALLTFSGFAVAAGIGSIATTVTDSFEGIAKLITAGAFLAGVGFAMAAIFKFKAHKDNPQQIPIGTPVALLFVAGALMFLPAVYSSIGETIFGSSGTTGKGSLKGTTTF